ncbi:MAG: TlpA disulfide reductase family protein [Candidatus Dormibacteria bacterium]
MRLGYRRRGNIAGMVVALVVVAGFSGLLVVSQLSVRIPRSNRVSTTPNSFVLPALDGDGDIRLASFRGKPTLVTFFASWCSACQGELPAYAVTSRALSERVHFIGVDSFETGNGMTVARQYGIAWWPLARDVGGAEASGLHDALGGIGMPMTAFYSANGKLIAVAQGALSAAELKMRLQQYFGV